MHRYQPRIHLVKWRDHTGHIADLEQEHFRTYIFPETVFTAVTAYQNQLVSATLIYRPSSGDVPVCRGFGAFLPSERPPKWDKTD